MIPPLFGKQEVGIWRVQKRFPQYGIPIWSWFLVTFFSATIDDTNLIFGHKLHIGTPYHWKRFLTRQIPTSCLPKSGGNKMNCELMLTYDTPALWQTGSRNLTGQKTLPMIWGTYMRLVTKYHISAINSCWEKCDERCAYMFNVYRHQLSRQTRSRNLTGLMAEIWYLVTSFI
jgi:hypothetical protein